MRKLIELNCVPTGLICEADVDKDEDDFFSLQLEYESEDGHSGFDELTLTSCNAEWLISLVEDDVFIKRAFPHVEDEIRRVVWGSRERFYLDYWTNE